MTVQVLIYVYISVCLHMCTHAYEGVFRRLTDSQNSDTTAPSGRELYHLQFSLQAASLETFGYTLVLLLNQSIWTSFRFLFWRKSSTSLETDSHLMINTMLHMSKHY